jgi:hypothetical protein
MRKALLALVLAASAQLGSGQTAMVGPASSFSADKLRQFCTDPTHSEPDPAPVYHFCYGFLIGVDEALTESGRRSYCLEPGVDYMQMRKVVVKFLEEHPERLHRSAISEFSEAMTAAFPCAGTK